MKYLILNNIFYIKWGLDNLIPVIIQEIISNFVLMFAWFSQESLFKTINTFNVIYFSRSRLKLWLKGELSNNIQYFKIFFLDCDLDVILLKIFQLYNTSCHTYNYTCFFNKITF